MGYRGWCTKTVVARTILGVIVGAGWARMVYSVPTVPKIWVV